MITKKIIIKTNLPFKEVLVILKKGISEDYFLSASKVMSGHIHGTKINGVINPPGLFSDPFKTIIKGDIISGDEETELHLRLHLNIISKVILVIWCIPMLAMLLHSEYHSFYECLELFGEISMFSLFPLILLWLKLTWDKSRLEEWLIRNFKKKRKA